MTIFQFSDKSLEKLQKATTDDPQLQQVQTFIKNGWPRNVNNDLQHFHAVRDELICDQQILFKGTKVVVPSQLQKDYVKQLHAGHIGSEATKRRAREFLYWKKMCNDIEEYVNTCSICNALKPHQQNEPLQLHEVPHRPFQLVASDLFEWNNINYLILVDSYSGFYELNTLKTTTSQTVISKLRSHFARYGIPEELQTDNGPQYISQEFKEFSEQWNFKHITSSPLFPQSNGLAENAVRSAKNLLEKSK